MLNNSAWGQSQIKGEAPPTTRDRNGGAQTGIPDPGAPKPPSEFFLRVRFLTAKPIREALARKILLAQSEPTAEIQQQLQGEIDRDRGDFIVVAVDVDGQDPRMVAGMMQGLKRMTKASLVEKVFLERKDKTRLALFEYQPPSDDNLGGKFIFQRTVDGQPFLNEESDTVKFVIDLEGNLKLNMRFKVSKMMYGGQLEY